MPLTAAGDPQAHIRVLIIDDQAAVRRGLRYVLLAFDDLDTVGEAATAKEALALCAEARPDVVVMDLMMPGVNPTDVIRAIRGHCPQAQVIALAGFWTEDVAQEVLSAGACSYLLKNVSAEELAKAIRAAHAGRFALDPNPNKMLPKGYGQPC